jgi:hypothetical protein
METEGFYYTASRPYRKMIAFWDIAPYILVEVDGRFSALMMATVRTSVNVGLLQRDYAAISQKAIFFMLAAVRTSYLTRLAHRSSVSWFLKTAIITPTFSESNYLLYNPQIICKNGRQDYTLALLPWKMPN